MADNVEVSSAAEYTVSTDEGAGGQVQRVKLAYSADGSETHVPADVDGLLVNLGANNDVTVAGVATAANQTTVIGHLDGVEGLLTTIDADTGSLPGIATSVDGVEALLTTIDADTSTLAVTGGGTEASALRVTVATDSTGVLSVDDNAGSLTVDAPVATPVFVRLSDGSAAITTLPVSLASVPSHAVTNAGTFAVQAAQSGTWNVTNVSGTVSLPTGAATAANQTTVIGHLDGVEALLTTIDADTGNLAAILTALQLIDNVVSGNEAQVDIVTMPTVATSTDVSLASTASSAQLIAANASRKGMILTNTDANAVLLYYGTTATASKFTVRIPGNGGSWEMPVPIYTGRIDAIWEADGSGSLIGSEL